ncbi:MAG: NAD(+)/NADH kinase [Simkaniaceae bacterium]|nr:NAD(+)/NADH kinase [Simkaniaceae bacterium]
MKMIALFPKVDREEALTAARQVISFLKQRGIRIVIEEEKAHLFDDPPLTSVDPSAIDLLITLGGDGTILRVGRRYAHLNVAILGINLGNLGFMADVHISDLHVCLQDIIDGKFSVRNRLMLEGTYPDGTSFFAINDCVLHRAYNPGLIEITVYIDDAYLNTFKADGLILSTPTGSTAYSLAAGGPILTPDLEAFVLSPVCPHTISHRPLVISSRRTIRFEALSKQSPIEVVNDGSVGFEMQNGETMTLKKSGQTFKLACLKRINFFSILREKLGLSGKLHSSRVT